MSSNTSHDPSEPILNKKYIESLDISKINSNILYEIMENSNYTKLFIEKFNKLNTKLINKLSEFRANRSNKTYDINFRDAIFVSKMITNLNNKLKNTKNENRKLKLNNLIVKSENIMSEIFQGNKYDLKELINEIEQFYLKTTRLSNNTRNLFYTAVDNYYNGQNNNGQNNNEKYKKQLRKILLNKKLSYTNIGQTFSSLSRERKKKIELFLENPNNILNHISKINNFYKLSKKKGNQEIFNKFKTSYEKTKKTTRNNSLETALEKAQNSKQTTINNSLETVLEKTQNSKQILSTNNISLLSSNELKKEKDITNLIEQLKEFIKKFTDIIHIIKSKIRNDLGILLKKSVEDLIIYKKRYMEGNFNDDKADAQYLNKILYSIKDAFNKYDLNHKWSNKVDIINERKKIDNQLLELNPRLNSKYERYKEDNIKNLIIKLNDFIKNSQNIKIVSKKEVRKNLERNLDVIIKSLGRFNDTHFNNKKLENKTLNDILNNIINTLVEYNKHNDIKIEDKNNKIKNIGKILFEINPELNYKVLQVV
jgi:hypothetical protein